MCRSFFSAGTTGEQILYHRQFGFCRGIAVIQLQGAVIGLAGHLGVYVTEVLVRGGVTGMSADRHFQQLLGLVVLALAGIQHGKVVIGLGQVGIVIGQRRKYFDGFGGLALLGEDQSFEESCLRIFWFLGEIIIDLGQRLAALALLE